MPNESISRRRFLKVSAAAAGAATLACCGLGYAARQAGGLQAPQTPPPTVDMDTPAFTYGEDLNMEKRILVTYATRTGSTVGVAAAIGETLGARRFAVDVKPINDNPSLDGYQAVMIGSAVNGARWLPEAVEFVGDNQAVLNRLPVALFCVHIMNLGDDQANKRRRTAYLDPIRRLITPVDEAYFAGVGMNPGEKSVLLRLASRIFKIGEGDCRDWNKIRGWGQTVFA
jgi:menaquinone-dependent protoporphyrinogen oxidase